MKYFLGAVVVEGGFFFFFLLTRPAFFRAGEEFLSSSPPKLPLIPTPPFSFSPAVFRSHPFASDRERSNSGLFF